MGTQGRGQNSSLNSYVTNFHVIISLPLRVLTFLNCKMKEFLAFRAGKDFIFTLEVQKVSIREGEGFTQDPVGSRVKI